MIIELVAKIESHNNCVGVLDVQLRQQIELLTGQSLVKKEIDAMPSLDVGRKCDIEIQTIADKVSRLELQQLNKSDFFSSIVSNVVEFAVGENKSFGNNFDTVISSKAVFVETSNSNTNYNNNKNDFSSNENYVSSLNSVNNAPTIVAYGNASFNSASNSNLNVNFNNHFVHRISDYKSDFEGMNDVKSDLDEVKRIYTIEAGSGCVNK